MFIGGAICTGFFSFIAVAANGYDLQLQYTPDVNDTMDADYWFQSPPFSWLSLTAVSCQPALLTTGSTYVTSNLGFIYTLDRLWQGGPFWAPDHVLPAVAYMNSSLHDCSVRAIEIDFATSDVSSGFDWWSW